MHNVQPRRLRRLINAILDKPAPSQSPNLNPEPVQTAKQTYKPEQLRKVMQQPIPSLLKWRTRERPRRSLKLSREEPKLLLQGHATAKLHRQPADLRTTIME